MAQIKVKVASKQEAKALIRSLGLNKTNTKVYARPDTGYTVHVFDVEDSVIEKLQSSPGVEQDSPIYL